MARLNCETLKENISLLLIIISSNKLDGKIKEKKLVDKSGIYNLVKNFDLNGKLTTLAAKAELKPEKIRIAKF